MAQNKYKLAAIQIETVVIPFSDVSTDDGITTYVNGSGATPFNEIAGMSEQKPKVNVETPAIKKLLDIVSVRGKCFSTNDVTLFYGKMDCGGFASGSVHRKVVISKGLISVGTIRASHGGAATLTATVHAEYDGTNLPFVYTEDVALPTVALLAESWFLGPVDFGGNLFETEGWDIDFGLSIDDAGSTGLPWPDFISVDQESPTASFDSKDIDVHFDSTGTGAVGKEMADVVFFLRKFDPYGSRVANATAEHLSFTFHDTYIHPTRRSGGAKQQVTFGTQVTPIYDGTNLPVVYDGATAIA